MKSFRNTFAVLAIMALASTSFAQDKFTIAGGGGAKQGSTYSAMIGDLAGVCSTEEMPLEEVNTNGGVQNLELLKGNKVKAALVPNDLLLAAKLQNPSSVATIKTLFALHPEELHLIARADVKTEGGYTVLGKNLGGEKVSFNNPEDLKNRAVGAVGGSVVTAGILSDFLHLGLKVTTFPKNSDLIAALEKGQIDAALIQAGAPSDAVKALPNGRFKFLPLRSNQELSVVYNPTKIQYANVSEGKAVDTLNTRALLVTRTFKSQEVMNNLAKLRACFASNLAKIQDKDGTHPKWQDVDLGEHGKWEYYDLPKVSSAAPAPAATPVTQKKR